MSMKLTPTMLRKIIMEEVSRLNEGGPIPGVTVQYGGDDLPANLAAALKELKTKGVSANSEYLLHAAVFEIARRYSFDDVLEDLLDGREPSRY